MSKKISFFIKIIVIFIITSTYLSAFELKIAPLKKAQDAIELVTDGMNIEDVLKELIDIFRSKIPEEVWPTPNP